MDGWTYGNAYMTWIRAIMSSGVVSSGRRIPAAEPQVSAEAASRPSALGLGARVRREPGGAGSESGGQAGVAWVDTGEGAVDPPPPPSKEHTPPIPVDGSTTRQSHPGPCSHFSEWKGTILGSARRPGAGM